MAEARLTLELSSPLHEPVDIDTVEVVVPGSAGVFTVLPGHTPTLTTLAHGVVIAYDTWDNKSFYAVHCGTAEVLHDKIVILADVMETQGAIDKERAEAALARAERRLAKPDKSISVARAEAALARARARIQAHHGQEY